MYLSYLSIYLSIFLSVYLSVFLYIYLSTYIYLTIYLAIYLAIYMPICLSIYLFVCLSIYLSREKLPGVGICDGTPQETEVCSEQVCLSFCFIFIYLSIYLSIYLCLKAYFHILCLKAPLFTKLSINLESMLLIIGLP